MLHVEWIVRPAAKPSVTLASITFPNDMYGSGFVVPVGVYLPDGIGGRHRHDFAMTVGSESVVTLSRLPDVPS